MKKETLLPTRALGGIPVKSAIKSGKKKAT